MIPTKRRPLASRASPTESAIGKISPFARRPSDFAPDADDSRLTGGEIAIDVPAVLRVVRLGHQEIHRLAQDFGRGVAEQPLGRRVERRDSAALVDHDDRIDGRVEKGL